MKYSIRKIRDLGQNRLCNVLAVGLFLALPSSTFAAPGDLDLTFGSGGIAITRGANLNSLNTAVSMAIQSDSKIVVVGDGVAGFNNYDFVVVRYNTDGSLDKSFGGTGIIHTPVGNSNDLATSVAIQADGKIVVAGVAGSSFAVVRYEPNGSLDTSFGGTGKIILTMGSSSIAYGLAIQTDGKIVASGRVDSGFAIVRYNTDGSLDTSFNGSGIVLTPVGGGANAVAIQADGKIVAAGGNQLIAVVRYNKDGKLDTSFNGTGIVLTSGGRAYSVAIQSDGKIVVAAGNGGNYPNSDFVVVRYDPNGSLDPSFGGTGKIIIPMPNSYSHARSVAIQSDGKIVAVGYSWNNIPNADLVVVRLNQNGTLDTAFNGTGIVVTPFCCQSYASAVAIQADGKIVVAGGTDDQLYDFYDFVVIRYQGDPPPPNTNGKIAYTSDRDGIREIYVMNADGSNQVRLTNNLIVDDRPTWSPDGTRIAFVSQRVDGSYAIFSMNSDGTHRTEITPIADGGYTNVPYYTGSISWSPDGKQIVFQDKLAGFNYDIFVADVNGGRRRNLTTDNPGYDSHPSWSPDGSKILFSSIVGFAHPRLYTIDPDGTDRQPLPDGSANGAGDYQPGWSPAGDRIAFVVNVGDFHDVIYTANSDGTDRQFFDGCSNLSCRPNRQGPVWSPDGAKIIFTIWEDLLGATTAQIYVKNVGGRHSVQLTTFGRNFNPSWQPLSP
jgi:uncharacterized delta-60 repeat protein